MNAIGFILIGLAVSFNFVVIIKKYRMHRYIDATLDMLLFAIIAFMFIGTFSALVTGTIASMFVSIYLYFRPVTMKELFGNEDDEYEDEE